MKKQLFIGLLLFIVEPSFAQLDSLIIESQNLNQSVKVFTYSFATYDNSKRLVYLTDGEKLIQNGALEEIIRLSNENKIQAATYVFVSTLDVNDPSIDYRNDYFFGNPSYLEFFKSELIPMIEAHLEKEEKHFNIQFEAQNRVLVGVSFGALNAAYFSAKSDNLFQNYALLSPITYPYKQLLQDIVFSKNENLTIFLSSGTWDAEKYVEELVQIYKTKGHQIQTIQTDGGHDFENWNQQWETVLSSFQN